MENNSPSLRRPIPPHFLSSLSSTSPFLPCWSSNWWLDLWRKRGGDRPRRGGGQKAAHATPILPVEAYEVFLCECGSRSYAGNVSLCSARTRPEKPTTLFKEMAVRGPLANSPPLCVSGCSAQSAPSFLVKNDNYFPLWKN